MKNRKKLLLISAVVIVLSIVIIAVTNYAKTAVEDNNVTVTDNISKNESADTTVKDNKDTNDNNSKKDSSKNKKEESKTEESKTEENKTTEENKKEEKKAENKEEKNSQKAVIEDKSKTQNSSSNENDSSNKVSSSTTNNETQNEKKEEPNITIIDEVNGNKVLASKRENFDGSKNLEYYTKQLAGYDNAKYNDGYVVMMFGLREKKAGPLSGWVYYVNGVKPNCGMRDYYPKKGDNIVWKYVRDGVN